MTDNSNNSTNQQLAMQALETRLRLLEEMTIGQKHEITALNKTNERLESEFTKFQDRIRSGWGKVLWMIGGSIIAAFMTWIMRGGLHNVSQ